jgi:ElaB/YqjD/DUF883 family membrane-anchored ribosome-binding protein
MANRTEEVRDKVHDTRHSLQELGSSVKEAAQEGMDNLRHTATEYLEQGKAKAKEIEQSLESRVRSNPLAAVCIATGIGFLLGACYMRR